MVVLRSRVAVAIALFSCLAILLLNDYKVMADGDVDGSMMMMRGRQLMQAMECGSACSYRCSKASRAKLCLRNCNVCCQKCQCVPPGTAGNREACPCYAALKNSQGTGKCP